VILALDADRAGQEAMLRAQKVALGREMRLRVAKMPDGVDPAELLQQGELERFQGLLDEAVDLPAFQIEMALARGGPSASEREKTLTEVAPVLNAMGETVGRDELVRRVASALDTEPGLVARRVEAAVAVAEPVGRPSPAVGRGGSSGGGDGGGDPGPSGDPGPARMDLAPSPRELRERALLAMCIAEPSPGKDVLERVDDDILGTDLARRTVAWLRDHLADPMAGLPRDDEQLVSFITQLVMSSKREPSSADAMELNLLLLQQRALEDRITVARGKDDWDTVKTLSEERADLVTKIAGAERV
jgi:DNA primase